MRGPRSSVPADLLHVVIQLEGEAVAIDGEGAVVDAGIELRRQIFDLHALAFEEGHRFPQLAIAAHLQAKGHERGVRAQPQLLAQRERIERHAVMLGVGAQEDAVVAAVVDFLGDREAEIVAIEAEHAVHVFHEEPYRPMAHDLERPCEQDAADVVLLLAHLGGAQALLDRDALRGGVQHLGQLGLVR